WLLVIFIQPWVGLVIYYLIGENVVPRRRIEMHSAVMNRLREFRDRFANRPDVVHPELPDSLQATVALAEKLGHMPILGGNSVQVMSRTADTIDMIIADIDAAQKHVHLLFYIFADDKTGQRIGDAL